MTVRRASLTALMPVKNYHPRFVAEALASIFAQTSSDWRLLIVVEPSDFSALPPAISAALLDGRVQVIFNRGEKLAGAYNTGMRMAESEFVAIIMADDLWTPEAVEVLSRHIAENPAVDFFHTGLRVIDEECRPIAPIWHPPRQLSAHDFVFGTPVKHLLCWRRSKALSFGGMDESLNNVGPDDYDFPWTMFENGALFLGIDRCLYQYRDHREAYRLTTHLPRSTHLKEMRKILEKHGIERAAIEKRLKGAKYSFLRQCLHRNRFDRWLNEKIIGIDPRKGWRESYQSWRIGWCDSPEDCSESANANR